MSAALSTPPTERRLPSPLAPPHGQPPARPGVGTVLALVAVAIGVAFSGVAGDGADDVPSSVVATNPYGDVWAPPN